VEIPSKLQDKTIDAFFPRSANVLKKQSTSKPLFLPQVSILKQIFFFFISCLVSNLTVVRTYYISSA